MCLRHPSHWFPRITLTASGTKQNFLWGQKKDQPSLETYRISTTSTGKFILKRSFSPRNVWLSLRWMQPKRTSPVFLDSISYIFTCYHAMKSSTWKHPCSRRVSQLFTTPSQSILLAQRRDLFNLTEQGHCSTTQREQGIQKRVHT